MRLSSVSVFAVAALTACHRTPPAAPVPRSATSVAASFGKTWDATIDAFASRGIPIATLDRASGLIVPAGTANVPRTPERGQLDYADCGRSASGSPIVATGVRYNVVIRGDSAQSTVQVRTFYQWSNPLVEGGIECSSTGRFETEAEASIAARAEGRQPVVALTTSCAMQESVDRDGDNFVVRFSRLQRNACVPTRCTLKRVVTRMFPADALALCRAEPSLWDKRQ